MRKAMIAAALLLAASPALAQWGLTKWGMTPEQVIKATPGAAMETYNPRGDLSGMQRLVQAPSTEGAIQLKARFYFDPAKRGLQIVDLLPVDMKECGAFRAAVVARLGDVPAKREVMKRPDYDATIITLHWDDKPSGDTIEWAGILFPDSETEYGICKLIRRNAA